MDLETLEAGGPFGVGLAQPVVHWEQALEVKPRRTALAVAFAADQARSLQHLEVLGDRRLGERGGRREFHHASFAGCEALEDRTAGGVGKSPEGAAQGVSSHYPEVI